MHAKQNLKEVIDLLNKNISLKVDREENEKLIYELLWEGDIDGIETLLVEKFGKLRRDKKAALKKLQNYFGSRKKCFEYSRLKKMGRPIGSGTIESAIRRVINMKLKSNGIFWLKENCERMLYLRCQFLTGRWNTLEEKLDSMRLNLYGVNGLEGCQRAS